MPHGWKKIGFASKGGAYENGNNRIVIDKINDEWFVDKQVNNGNERNDRTLKTFKTKSEALRFANKYMREHPRG